MRARPPLGVSASWPRWAAAFVTVTGILYLGSRFRGPGPMWGAIAAAVLAAVLIVVTWRLLPLTSVLRRRLSPTRPAPTLLDTTAPADIAPLWDNTPAAVRAAGDDVVAVVAIDGPDNPPSVFDRNRVESATFIPLDVLAVALRQFDVRLSGIDVLSVGRRRASRAHHPYAATYTGMIGDHAAMGQRRSWCVLRMNRIQNATAIASRDSVASTLAACAARLAAELSGRKITARVLDAAELADVDVLLGAGIGAEPRPGWGDLRHGAGSVSAYWMTPKDITTENLDRIWVPDSDATAVAVQLRPTEDGGAEVGVIVRYSTPTALASPPVDGLNSLSGRHGLAVRAGLADAPDPQLRVPYRRVGDDEDIHIPLGATGILLGSLASGHPLLMNLAAASPLVSSTVTVAGELALLVQVALRSAAIGYQVMVVSAQPDRWRDATATGLQVIAAGASLPDEGPPVMVIYDTPGAAGALGGPAPAITVRAVRPAGASIADVHIEQESPDTATVRTAGFSTRITIDVNPERNLIKHGPRAA